MIVDVRKRTFTDSLVESVAVLVHSASQIIIQRHEEGEIRVNL